MTPQFQRYRVAGQGAHGDCHRTCIAMVLDMDRDDVPHFNADVAPGTPGHTAVSQAAKAAERAWLADHGLVPVGVPFPGTESLDVLLEQFGMVSDGLAVVLGCRRDDHADHSVVLYQGRVYDPLGDPAPLRPMLDGMWWVTIYALATGPLRGNLEPASVAKQEAS